MEPSPIDIGSVKGRLRVVPLIELPEITGIKDLKEFIRERILNKENDDLAADEKAVAVLGELGGDLMINAFACNFEINGEVNKDVVSIILPFRKNMLSIAKQIEANYLNTRIFEQFSVSNPDETVANTKLFLTSTVLSQDAYKGCLDAFKSRLGLEGREDLYILINVTMSPWPTSYDFVRELADEFKKVAEEEMKRVVHRNVLTPGFHGFIIQGYKESRLCGVHLPMFNMENHRKQLIISFSLPEDVQKKLIERKEQNPGTYFTCGSKDASTLDKLIRNGASFRAEVQEGLPSDNKPISHDALVSNIQIIYERSLRSQFLSPKYPRKMVFFVYSTQSIHMDHVLSCSPNIQLNSEMITLDFKTSSEKHEHFDPRIGFYIRLSDVNEGVMQPLIKSDDSNREFDAPGLRFIPRALFRFRPFKTEEDAFNADDDDNDPNQIMGTVRLGPSVFADYNMLNMDGGSQSTTLPINPAFLGTSTNVSGLVAEYPNPSSTIELRNRVRNYKVRRFNDALTEAKQSKAKEVIQSYQDKNREPPAWAKHWHGQETGGRQKDALPTRPYHHHVSGTQGGTEK
jgi:hypothetical protein